MRGHAETCQPLGNLCSPEQESVLTKHAELSFLVGALRFLVRSSQRPYKTSDWWLVAGALEAFMSVGACRCTRMRCSTCGRVPATTTSLCLTWTSTWSSTPAASVVEDLGRECWPDYAEIHLHRQVDRAPAWLRTDRLAHDVQLTRKSDAALLHASMSCLRGQCHRPHAGRHRSCMLHVVRTRRRVA